MRCPTADEVAWAIVAAARETEEDPIICAMKQMGLRCRHYALAALEVVFSPSTREDKECLARLVGCWGKPLAFYNNSRQQTREFVSEHPHLGKRWAKWFDEDAFARVVAALRSASTAVVLRGPFVNLTQTKVVTDEFAGALVMRRPVVADALNVTSEFFGDPAAGRSALATAKLWKPYARKQSSEQEDEHGE